MSTENKPTQTPAESKPVVLPSPDAAKAPIAGSTPTPAPTTPTTPAGR